MDIYLFQAQKAAQKPIKRNYMSSEWLHVTQAKQV